MGLIFSATISEGNNTDLVLFQTDDTALGGDDNSLVMPIEHVMEFMVASVPLL